MHHVPVLLSGVLSHLRIKPGERVLDCTIGLGGHAEAFLQESAPDGTLTGLDADEKNLQSSRERLRPFGERVELLHANFSLLPDCLPEEKRNFDVIFADLGLSSPHLDDPARGFSFRADGPLDMRLDQTGGETAAGLLKKIDPEDLTRLFAMYGEIRGAGKLSHALAKARGRGASPETSGQLKMIVEEVYGYRAPAILPQVFQALRIEVNDELSALRSFLSTAPAMLKSGGRCGIISFHSLEDREVKRTFRALSAPVVDEITGHVAIPASFFCEPRRAIVPDDEEVAKNPRARSAKFRVLTRELTV